MFESLLSDARRVARFVRHARLLDGINLLAAPQIAPLLASAGLNVKSIHAVHAAQTPERIALVDDAVALTYAECDEAINRIARSFVALGIKRGDRVVLCMENRAEYILFWFAGFRAGIAMVHASYRSTADELRYLVQHCRARGVVGSSRTADVIRKLVEDGFAGELIFVDDVAVSPRQHHYPEWAAPHATDFYSPGRDARGENVVYTSGTTGKPKGALRDFSGMGLIELSRIGERLPVHAGDRHLVVCPLYHSGAQAFVAMLTALGGTLYLRPRFEPADALKNLSRWAIHSVFMVPTMIQRILDLGPEVHRANPTPSLQALISGAASFPDALRRRAVARFGAHNVWDFYGATELGWLTLIDGAEMLERPSSVGRPLPGQELRVLDSERRSCGPGETGAIWVRTAQTMQGYLDDAAATDAVHKEGWVTVDDLGYLDDAGYLYLAGRNRDMVISGGVNIYPVEIEEIYAHHPAVSEVAVLGVPDDEWGERLVGFVVGDVDNEELVEFGKTRLASHKVPREWVSVPELPRNPTGKVLKRILRDSHRT